MSDNLELQISLPVRYTQTDSDSQLGTPGIDRGTLNS